MSASRMGMLSLALTLTATTITQGAEPTPRLDALQLLGQQNISSITSDPRMGGPQGISPNEMPAAAAHRTAQRVDAIHAIRAGSTSPVPDIQLAHPSHVPGAVGSRPFVSDGPISRSPGTRRRSYRPYPYPSNSQLTSTPTPAPPSTTQPPQAPQRQMTQPVSLPRSTATPIAPIQVRDPAAIFTSNPTLRDSFPGIGGRL